MNDHIYRSKNIMMCPDGKYRWVYELDMYKSSVIIKEVWRAMLIAGVIVLAFLFVINIMDNDLMETLQFVVQTATILLGIFLVLSIIGYLIFAFMIGGKYCVVFEMDEEGINHKQHQKHVKKAELIGAITALAGMAGGNLSTVGTGVLAAARTSMLTYFDDVKELEILPKEHLIRKRNPEPQPSVCGGRRLCICGKLYPSPLPECQGERGKFCECGAATIWSSRRA